MKIYKNEKEREEILRWISSDNFCHLEEKYAISRGSIKRLSDNIDENIFTKMFYDRVRKAVVEFESKIYKEKKVSPMRRILISSINSCLEKLTLEELQSLRISLLNCK